MCDKCEKVLAFYDGVCTQCRARPNEPAPEEDMVMSVCVHCNRPIPELLCPYCPYCETPQHPNVISRTNIRRATELGMDMDKVHACCEFFTEAKRFVYAMTADNIMKVLIVVHERRKQRNAFLNSVGQVLDAIGYSKDRTDKRFINKVRTWIRNLYNAYSG